MNLRQLELFIAVAETGSFSRGAEKTSLTQSTASQHVASLEAESGGPLFDRTRRGVELTAQGTLFLRHARRILAERDLLLEALAGEQRLEKAQLTIGASNIPANYLIPPFLPQLAQVYPGITLTMRTGDSTSVLQQLLAGEIELALVGNRRRQKGVDYSHLYRDRLVLVVGRQHPWREKSSILLNELAGGRFILRDSGSGSGVAVESALHDAGFNMSTGQVLARLGSNEAIQQTVAAGLGCAFVSELSIAARRQSGELITLAVEGVTVERDLWLVRPGNRTPSPAAAAFCELLLRHFAG